MVTLFLDTLCSIKFYYVSSLFKKKKNPAFLLHTQMINLSSVISFLHPGLEITYQSEMKLKAQF